MLKCIGRSSGTDARLVCCMGLYNGGWQHTSPYTALMKAHVQMLMSTMAATMKGGPMAFMAFSMAASSTSRQRSQLHLHLQHTLD